jgi:trk system potassium uptake protein TrkA
MDHLRLTTNHYERKEMKVVILGCGRVGSRLAALMEEDGHQVSIIDSEPDAFTRLPETFQGRIILGTGIDVDVLKSAGIEQADAFAAVTNFDNTNIMACEVAKEIFGVEQVLARIYDPGRESFYHELGLETVCPTTLVSTAAYNILSPERISPLARKTAPLPHISGGMPEAAPAQPERIAPAAPTAPTQAPPAQPVGTAGPQTAATATAERMPDTPPANQPEPQKNGRGLRGLFRP